MNTPQRCRLVGEKKYWNEERKMTEGLITVVVPIYKTEKYLNRCIESIVSQTYRNLEILLIDDGSPDACPQICDAWAKKDPRICVIHKQNEGLSAARNTGIDCASGEFICFFDSDDYIAKDALEKACGKIRETESDIVTFGFSTVDDKGIRSVFIPDSTIEIYKDDAVQKEFLPELLAPMSRKQKKYHISVWVMLFSTDVIRRSGLRFVSERKIISEDTYALLDIMASVKRIAVLPEALYYYYTNDESLSRSYRSDRYEKIKNFYLASAELCRQRRYNKDVIFRLADPYLGYTIMAMKQEMQTDTSEKYDNISAIIRDDVLQYVLRENDQIRYNLKRRILFWAIRNRIDPIVFLILFLQCKIEQ